MLSKAVQRVESPDSQVVDADHYYRVSDNDLAQEHDFFFGTLGAKEMPTVRSVYDILNTARGCHCHSLIYLLNTRLSVDVTMQSSTRHATSPNTMTIMTDVSHYSGPILSYGEELMRVQRCRFRLLISSFTVVDERLGIYPTVE